MSGFNHKNETGSVMGYILCIVFGIVICLWPGTILLAVCRIAGLLILLLGIFRLLGCIRSPYAAHRGYPVAMGVILCVVGVWILCAPGTFLKLIPMVIGVVLIFHGVKNICFSVNIRRGSDSWWGVSLVLGILAVIFGIVLIRCAFLALEIGMIILGIALIYTGVSGLVMDHHAGGGKKGKIIDVDYKEV